MKKLTSILTTSAVSFAAFAFVVPAANAAVCESHSMATPSSSPRSLTITADQVSPESMQILWDIVAQSPRYATPLLGKIIAADQSVFADSCTYPGIGLGVGAGRGPSERSVTLWIWADKADMLLARYSVLVLMQAVTPTTTTTTTVPAAPAVQLSMTSSLVQIFSPVAAQSATAVIASPVAQVVTAVQQQKKCRRVVKRVKSKKTGKIVKTKKQVCR